MTKPNEHGSAPATPSPIYRHSSETQRSENDAGGKLRQQYQWPISIGAETMTALADLNVIALTTTAKAASARKAKTSPRWSHSLRPISRSFRRC
jgi:hypothetical protein